MSDVTTYQAEAERLRQALAQIERLAREGTREGHLIRDAIQEVAAKALQQDETFDAAPDPVIDGAKARVGDYLPTPGYGSTSPYLRVTTVTGGPGEWTYHLENGGVMGDADFQAADVRLESEVEETPKRYSCRTCGWRGDLADPADNCPRCGSQETVSEE